MAGKSGGRNFENRLTGVCRRKDDDAVKLFI